MPALNSINEFRGFADEVRRGRDLFSRRSIEEKASVFWNCVVVMFPHTPLVWKVFLMISHLLLLLLSTCLSSHGKWSSTVNRLQVGHFHNRSFLALLIGWNACRRGVRVDFKIIIPVERVIGAVRVMIISAQLIPALRWPAAACWTRRKFVSFLPTARLVRRKVGSAAAAPSTAAAEKVSDWGRPGLDVGAESFGEEDSEGGEAGGDDSDGHFGVGEDAGPDYCVFWRQKLACLLVERVFLLYCTLFLLAEMRATGMNSTYMFGLGQGHWQLL